MPTNSCGELDWRFIHINKNNSFSRFILKTISVGNRRSGDCSMCLMKVGELMFRLTKLSSLGS